MSLPAFQNMPFENALMAMRLGQKVTRECWHEDSWLEISTPPEFPTVSFRYIYRCLRNSGVSEPPPGASLKDGVVMSVWQPSMAEIMADDWQSYSGVKKS